MANEAEDLEALFESVAEERTRTIAKGQQIIACTPAEVEQEKAGKGLYAQIGRCTRQLHDAMRQLGYDQTLLESTNQIVSAKSRLEYVAELTEKAANKVLNAIDAGLPEEDLLIKQSRALTGSWDALFAGKMSIEEFKSLAQDSRSFAILVTEAAERQKARMMEIMMAQDFQDITGQIIKKIVSITHAHEQELMKILRDHAHDQGIARGENQTVDLMAGPEIPSNALGQDDVDNLLADLGF